MHTSIGLTLGFFFVYSSLIGYLRSSCWRDPTSKFFQPQRAYVPTYSAHRIQEAISYADLVSAKQEEVIRTNQPKLCIGIPSVKRDDISYLKSTLGSLQHGLSTEERSTTYFVVLLAHTNRMTHPDGGQPWLASMADKLPSYHDDPEHLALAYQMELNQSHGIKAKFDYSIVMEECAKSGAPHTLMVEDDVVFMDGWLHRTIQALDTATTKSWTEGHTDFLYLRLFYYEGLLGWNSESWPKYLASSLALIGGVYCVLLLTRRYIPKARLCLTQPVFILITLVFTPLLIILFFAAGGNCMLPPHQGVQPMPTYTCCGQGLVFSRATITNELLPLFHRERWSQVPTDSFIEKYADSTGGLRWALTPVVMQHVGGQSSHGVFRGTYGTMTPSHIWNFGFERNDAERLAAEHWRVNHPT
ncbi:hypothetical protein F4804DRAFT_303979 [Jackrogersella minutella]|nr:hypothetical protein F4804DRAFT_303979 [Jackrogersella minutella]